MKRSWSLYVEDALIGQELILIDKAESVRVLDSSSVLIDEVQITFNSLRVLRAEVWRDE